MRTKPDVRYSHSAASEKGTFAKDVLSVESKILNAHPLRYALSHLRPPAVLRCPSFAVTAALLKRLAAHCMQLSAIGTQQASLRLLF